MKTLGIISAVSILVLSSAAIANSFSLDGIVIEPSHEYVFQDDDRYLVPDGSFEGGCDYYWSCSTDNTCTWITDLVPLGLSNYDGEMTAWLGGFCGDQATEWTRICQTMYISTYCPPGMSWYWQAYINEGGSRVSLSLDGDEIWEKILLPEDHLLGYRQENIEVPWYYLFGDHEVCLNYDRNGAYGDNYFMDYLEFTGLGLTPVESCSFSTVKSLY